MSDLTNQFQSLYAVSIYADGGVQTSFKASQDELKKLMKRWARPAWLRGNFSAVTPGDVKNYLTIDLRRVVVIEAIYINDAVAETAPQDNSAVVVPAEVITPKAVDTVKAGERGQAS